MNLKTLLKVIEIENLVEKEKKMVSSENKAAAALDKVFGQEQTTTPTATSTPGMFRSFQR